VRFVQHGLLVVAGDDDGKYAHSASPSLKAS
jgi:hypothetical protein